MKVLFTWKWKCLPERLKTRVLKLWINIEHKMLKRKEYGQNTDLAEFELFFNVTLDFYTDVFWVLWLFIKLQTENGFLPS